jgi:serine/threonine-protein kinase PknG
MGGVRRVDDTGGDIYGTKGYSAPEANENPSFVSDLYTVARTLAVLIMEFKFQGAYEYSLPTPQEQPIFAQQESLYRFLLKATREDPDHRFQTADEMAEQLLGVLREIVAVGTGTAKPAESALFFGDAMGGLNAADALHPNYRLLPALKVDSLDPAANLILSAGAITGKARQALFERAMKQFPDSQEAPLRLADALIEESGFDTAEKLLAQAETADPFDWRVHWLRGRLLLARERPREAYTAFDRVYAELPGELAPKLGAALAAELAADLKTAIRLYDRVSRTDPNFTSAAFGLARCLAASGDRDGSIAAYGRVPTTSAFYTEAQMALARTCLQSHPAAPGESELVQASKAIQALTIEGFALHRLSAELLLTAIERIEARAFTPNNGNQILGQTMQSAALRAGAERELRACAHFAQTYEEKVALVDRANEVRPKTLT